MARKDIDIRIKAKDEASRNAKKIADALKLIATDGRKASEGASKFGGALGALNADVAKLEGNLSGLKAFGGIVNDLDRAASAVSRLEKQLEGTQRGFDSVRQQTKELSVASSEMRSRYEAEESALKERNAELKAATEAQRANKTATEAAEKALERYNDELYTRGRGKNRQQVTTVLNPEQMAQSNSLLANLGTANATRTKIESTIGALRQTIAGASASLTELGTELKESQSREKEFAQETMNAGNAVLNLRTQLHQARASLDQFEQAAGEASGNLGGLAASQRDVENATARATAEIARMRSALAATKGAGLTVIPTAEGDDGNRRQVENLRLLTQEHEKAQNEVRSLAREMKAAEAPTEELGAAFGVAQARARETATALNQQRDAIRGTSQQAQMGYAAWARAMNPIVGSSERAAAAQDRLNASTRATAAAAAPIAPMAQRNANAMRQQAQSTNQASAALDGFGRNTRTTLSFIQRMRGEVLALTSGFIGFYAAVNRGQQAMQAFMAVERAENRLSVAFDGNTALVTQEIAYLNAEADRLGFTFDALANGYGKISIAAQSAGFSVQDTRDLFISLAEAARVNGSSMDEMNGVLRAVDQMLSKGKVQAEELRGQLGDRMSGAFKLFADGLGVTTERLDEMLKAGEVYADRNTMLGFAQRLEEMYGKRVPAAMQGLAASLGTFQRDMEKVNVAIARGFVPAIQDAITAFSEFANSAEGAETFRNIGEAAGTLISVLVAVPQYFDLISLAVQGLVAVKIGQWVSSLSGGLGGLVTNYIAFSSATATAAATSGRFAAIQRTVIAGVRQTSFAMAIYEAQLRASVASTGLARIGTLGLANAVAVLRTGMLATTAIARGMWVAIGGPVGIAVAAITLGIGAWATSTSEATSALQEHERQVQIVEQAYAAAKGGVVDWASAFKNLTELDARQNLAKLESQFDSAFGSIRSNIRIVENLLNQALRGGDLTNKGYLADLQKLDAAIKAFQAGGPAADLKAALSDLGTGSEFDAIRLLATDLNDVVSSAEDGGTSIVDLGEAVRKQRAVVEGFSEDTREAAEETLGLGEAVDTVNGALEDTTAIDAYNSALDDLKEKIPSLAEEMKRLKEVTDLNTSAWAALVAAIKTGDFSNIMDVMKLWGQGLTDQNNAQFGGAGGGSAASLIKQFEGYRDQAYWDVNHFRVGYGSDTTTSANGTVSVVVEGTVTTQSDADRDLARRIGEFQNTIKSEIGADRFGAFNPGQQAALTSIAYNYGNLTKTGIVDTIRNGTVEEITAAIRSLAGHNDGVNSGRRNQEADIFARGGTSYELSQQQYELEQDITRTRNQRSQDNEFQIRQAELQNQKLDKQAAVESALNDALKEKRRLLGESAVLTAEETGNVERQAAALWEAQNPRYELLRVEEQLAQLEERRNALIEQREMAIEQGDAEKAAALKIEIEGLNVELQASIDKAIAMWQAIGGPEADAAIAKLQSTGMAVKAAETRVGAFGLSMETWRGVFDTALNGVLGAFDAMAQAIANGENAFAAFGTAVLQTLAQVLQQIAVAILRMQILKMLSGMGGGIGEFATAALGGGGMVGHTGGVVGSMAIGGGNARIGRPDWVHSAFTYHTGGRAGFAPDEVSATLKKGEEILTEEDPRHRDNMGGSGPASDGTRLKQVLAIGDDEIANAMQGAAGEQVIMTNIKRNAPTIRRMLGM